MNQKGPFIKLEGKNMKMLASPSYVLNDFVPKEGYPKCCSYHESVLEYVVNWWKKFPNCCKEHEAMVSSGYIKKEDYNYVPEKIITCYAYFEYHLSQKINEDNWFTDIKHYLEHLSFSFGHPAIGFAQLQHLIEYYLENHKPTEWVFPADRRSALIEYLTKKVEKADKNKNDTDLNLLYSVYQKWLKTVPDIHYFSYLKETTTAKAPLNLFLYDMDYNPYTGMTSSQVKTTVELVQSLFDLTKQVLSQIDTVQMVKDKVISDAQLFKINLINENHRIKQLKLVQEYNKSEAKYVKIIKRWLVNEKEYFGELIPELNKLPEPKPLPKAKPYTNKQKQSDSNNDQLHNQNNSINMTISILNDICYGRLKPWTIDFSDMSKLSQKVKVASKVKVESPLDLNKKLLALLSEHDEYQQLKTEPIFTQIFPIHFTFQDEIGHNLQTVFYKGLIDTEALRFYNEVLANPYIQDLALDVEYQIGRKVLDALKDLICKTKEEIENLESSQNTKDADDTSLYVMSHLHKTLLALYFSIQSKYASYLTDIYESIEEFYLLVFNEPNIAFYLLESTDSVGPTSSITKSSLPKTITERKLSFGFNGDQEKLKSIIKLLCVHYSFLNESLCTQEEFVAIMTSKDLSASKQEVHLSCPTNQFTATIEHFKKIAPKFNYANIDKFGNFYSQDGTLLNQKLLSNTEIQSKLSEEIKTKIASFFS